MKPLLWKEYRELRVALIMVALAFVVVLVLCHTPVVGDGLRQDLPLWSMWVNMLAAVALGVGQVVSERRARTLDYVLARPASDSKILGAKFTAGSSVLLILVGLSLAVLYLGGTGGDFRYQVFRQIGYPPLLVYLFPMYWCLYACTLLFSTLAEGRAQALAGGLICVLAVITSSLSLELAFPLAGTGAWSPGSMASTSWLRLAHGTFLWIAAAGVWSLLTILVASAAAFILRRRWEARLGWPAIALLFLGLGVGPRFLKAPITEVAALGQYSLSSPALSGPVSLLGQFVLGSPVLAARGNRVCVGTKDGLAVVDFSDPAHPLDGGMIRAPLWTIDQVKIVEDGIYAVGRLKDVPADRAGILYAREVAPGVWDSRLLIDLGPTDGPVWIDLLQVLGKQVYVGTADGRESKLRVFELSAEGPARPRAEISIESWPREFLFRTYSVARFSMVVRGNYAYAAGYGTLLTIDVSDAANPRVIDRQEFDDSSVAPSGWEGRAALLGERLYVESSRTPTLLRYDLGNPARPVEIGRSIWRPGFEQGTFADEAAGRLMTAWSGGILAFPPPDGLWIRNVRYLKGADDTGNQRRQVAVTSGGLFYVLIGSNTIAAYPVAP